MRRIENLSRNIYARSNMTFDYIVIGAGLGGLLAAELICDAGKTFLVLEASKVAGGRVSTLKVGELPQAKGVQWVQDSERVREFRIEKGATWIQDGHDEMFKLAKQLKINLRKQFSQGEGLYLTKDNVLTTSQLTKDPCYGPLLLSTVQSLTTLSTQYFSQVLNSTPQSCPTYSQTLSHYDSLLISQHLQSTVKSPQVISFLSNMIEHTECAACDANSMHELLMKNACSKDIEIVKEFLGVSGGESWLVEGGTEGITSGLLKNIQLKHKKVNLSDTVKFGCVVKEIQNEGNTILIKTINNGRAEDFKCLKVIVNVPIATLKNIKISKLSEGKRLILENQLQTTNKKSFIISKQPFWRKLGFSGDCLFGPEYNINMTHDISPSDGSFGVLVFFHNGSKYSQWQHQFSTSKTPSQQKKSYLLSVLAKLFLKGDTSHPCLSECIFSESSFASDQFIESCFQSNTKPGTFTKLLQMGDDLSAYYRDENGLVFVGSEYSREFASYMEGAVRSARAKVQAEIRKKI